MRPSMEKVTKKKSQDNLPLLLAKVSRQEHRGPALSILNRPIPYAVLRVTVSAPECRSSHDFAPLQLSQQAGLAETLKRRKSQNETKGRRNRLGGLVL